jgi:hypothetical protein
MAKKNIEGEPVDQMEVKDVQGLLATIAQVQDRLERIEGKSGDDTPKRRPKFVTEFTALMREVKDEKGEVIGLATKLYNVREVRDTKENKKFYGLCNIDYINPKTGETGTLADADYIHFLEDAIPVLVKIDKWIKETREALDKKEGGGGRGFYMKKDPKTGEETISNEKTDFWIEYPNDKFIVTPSEGIFEGAQFEHDGLGFNL